MDIQIPQRNKFIRRYGWTALIAILLAAIITWALTEGRTSTYRISRKAITTGAVTQGSFNDYIRVNGRVETGVIVQVSALETGIVERKWVEEGAMVKAGDIIITLRNPLLRQQILDSESQLAEKQNMLRDTEIAMEKERLQLKRDIISAKTELNRKSRAARTQESLFKENLTSREDYLQAVEENQLAIENLKLLEDRLRQDSLYRTVQLSMMRESLDNLSLIHI